MTENKITRREAILSGSVIAVTPIISFRVGATDSGLVELDANVNVPTDTGIDVRIFEDIDGSGTPNYQQEKEITSSGIYEYDALQGETGQGIQYWMDIQLSGDGTNTPEVYSLEITLPEDSDAEEPEFEWVDNFSEGNADEWVNLNDNEPPLVSESATDTHYSIESIDNTENETITWVDGPNLDLRDSFEIRGVTKNNIPERRVRLGIIPDSGDSVLLIFNDEYDATYLATSPGESPDGLDTIDDIFNNVWVEWEIYSPESEEIIQAKVWEYGDTEPSGYQLEREFTGIGGQFSIEAGSNNDGREIMLDEVKISGEQFIPDEHDDLYLDAREFVILEETIPYKVRYNDPEEGWKDITETVERLEVSDDTVVELNTENHEIEGVGRGETHIEIEHEEIISGHNISCATVEIEDMDYLPNFRRVQAIMGDRGMQAIGVATIGASVVSGFTGSGWAGVALGVLVLILAWAMGGAPAGLAIAGVLFIVLAGMLRLEMQT